MPQPFVIPIKPQWLGDEALGKAKKFTSELSKQQQFFKNNPAYQRQQFGQIFADISAQEKKVKDWSKAFGEVFAMIGAEKKKVWDSFFARNENGMDRLIKKSRELKADFGTAFEVSMSRGIGFTLNKVTSGIEGALGKVFNLKNALLATAVGGVTYGLASRALRGGLGNVRDDARVRREFGGTLGSGVKSSVEDIASAAGVEGGDALAALTPIARAIKETRIGSVLKSGRKLTTQAQVDQVQKQTLGLATGYTKRLLTVFPEASPEEIGRLLAEAGTGEEGIGSLARFVGLGKASTRDLLADAKKKKLAIGDIVGSVLNRAGVTDQAASDQRHTFDFQIKSIGSQLSDALGNVGTSAIEKLNKSLGEGTTLAEKLQKYLSSDEGKKTIDKLGDALSRVVGFASDLAKRIPEAINWITEHKGTLLAIAGIYGAAKIGGTVAGVVGGAKEFLGGIRGSSPLTPLFVSQVGGGGGGTGGLLSTGKSLALGLGGVAAAGGIGAGLLLSAAGAAAGYTGGKVGTYLGKHVAPIGKAHTGLANVLYNLTGEGAADEKVSNFEEARFRKMLADKKAARDEKVRILEATTGMSHEQALSAVDHPNAPAPQINVVVKIGEKELAAHTTTEVRKQQTSQARNEAGI